MRENIDRERRRLEGTIKNAESVAAVARVVPAILGGEGPRRYFVAVQNNAGGLIGNFAELTVDGGRIEMTRLGRLLELIEGGSRDRVLRAPAEYIERYSHLTPNRNWQNVNMSPDFPTVGQVIADLYPQSGGRPVDGVISVDPYALAKVLEFTGPVTVPMWPEPIGSSNVVDVTLRAAYEEFEDEARVDFLGAVAEAVVQRLTSVELIDPAHIAAVLSEAVRGRHVMMYLTRPEEQQMIRRLGMDAGVPPVRSDSLLIVTQNAATNKLDYYLRRQVRYTARLRPGDGTAQLTGRVELRLYNGGPPSGLPKYVIGPNAPQFRPGENVSYLSLYVPTRVTAATLDGEPLHLREQAELGHRVYSAHVSVPANSDRTVAIDLEGTVRVLPGGWYELRLGRQPLPAPDDLEVVVEVPEGWRIAEVAGREAVTDRGRAHITLAHQADEVVSVRLERSP